MEAFVRRVEEEAGPVVSDSGVLSAPDDRRSESSEASASRDQQDETSPASVISTHKLPLYEGPEIIQRLNVFEEVELGAVIVFECQCKGSPVPTSKWYKDDVELTSADRVTIEDSVEADGKIRLTIQNARKSDEGAYRCKLENQEGVAATTGYLSVTGSSSSPKSDHSISSPPLLRAITEESNASQDLDETLSTPLDKILTGEYDLTTLPYSQYLELMKENKANNAQQTVSGLSSEGDERSRTPQQKSAENGDVTTTTTTEEEETDSRTPTVVMDTSETRQRTQFVENDFEMSVSSNSFDAAAPEETPPVGRVATYGLGAIHPIQVIRENFGDGSASFEADNRKEEEEEKRKKKIAGSNSPILREFNSIVAADDDDDGGGGGNGDFVGTTVNAADGKLSLAETVIAGRIGLPSDWEFAHYTQESEDNDVAVFGEHGLPYEAGNQVATAEEAVSGTIETPPVQIEVLPDPIQTPSQERIRESLVAVSESPVSIEASPGSGVVPVDGFVIRDSSGGYGLSERVEKMAELLESDFMQNPSNVVHEPVLPEKELSTWIGNKSDSSLQTPGKVDLDLKTVLPEPSKVETVADTTPETASVAGWEDEKITDEQERASKETGSQLPGEEADKRPPPEVAPETEGDLAVAFPANEVSVPEVRSFPVDFQSTVSHREKSGGTLPTTENTTPAGNFEKFNIGLLPEIPSAFTPLPDLTWEEEPLAPSPPPPPPPPVRVEDIEVSVMSDQSLVEWWVEWFQFPWFFYVLLVLMATVVASAMQLNPALLILVVSTVSVAGFFLFPLQGVKSNKKQL